MMRVASPGSILAISFFLALACANCVLAEESPQTIVFAAMQWEGDYQTQDKAGGVVQTPVSGSIYRISTDGTGQRKIVDLGGNTTYPHFSRDGAWLYFQVTKEGRTQTYRCKPDGSQISCLSEKHKLGSEWSNAFGGTLSGDGRKLAYVVHNGKSGRIVICNSDGSEARFVVPDLGYIYMAALNETGDKIVFSGPATGYRLYLSEKPFVEASVLTPELPDSYVPQFMPDGESVVFMRRDGDLYSVSIGDRRTQRITQGADHVEFRLSRKDHHGSTDGPHLSPDGKTLAYIAKINGVDQVCTIGLDGKGQRQLTSGDTPCGRVRWSPDGRQLAFVSWDGEYPQLFVVTPANASRPRKITDLDAAVYWVDWEPVIDTTKN